MTGQISPFFEVLLSAVPVAIIVILLGVYLTGLYLREDTKRKLTAYLKNIRSHDIAIQKYNGLLGKFNEFENKPPFSNQFDKILKKLAELHGNRDREMKLYSLLRGESDQHSKKSIKNWLLAPFYWLETHQKLNSLDHLDTIVSINVDDVGIDVHQLMHIQNEIVRQITTAWQEIQELEHNIQTLIQRRVRADMISAYMHTFTRLRQRFITIPAFLLTPTNYPTASDDILKHIADAYIILEESRPTLQEPLANTRIWLEQTELLPQAIQQPARKVFELQDQVALVPSAIDTTQFQNVLKEANLAVEHAERYSEQIDPFQLGSILEALTQQYEKLEQNLSEVRTAGEVLDEYYSLRNSLADQWNAIETLVPQLTENPVLPILLTETNEELEFLKASFSRLLDMKKKHTIQQLKDETPGLQEKIEKTKALQADLLTMQATQAELMVLVNRLQYPKVQAWVQKTETARTRLAEYAADNYFQPPSWQGLNLDEEIQKITSLSEDFLPGLNQPVREEELLEKWQNAQVLDKRVTIVQDGLNNQLQQRKSLIEQEKSILSDLGEINAHLNRFKDLRLDREQIRFIKQYYRALEKNNESLADRSIGKIEDKGKQLAALKTEISAQIDEWLVTGQQALQSQNETLSSILDEISKDMHLNDDVFGEIQTYFAEIIFSEPTDSNDLEAIIEALITTNEYQNTVQQYLQTIRPIHAELTQHRDAYHKIRDNYNAVMSSAGSLVDFSSSWDQNVINIERMQTQGQDLEHEMDRFLQEHHHSQNLIRKLKEYTSRYEEQLTKLTDLLTQIQKEKQQLKEAEDALQAVMRQWEQVAHTWPDDRIVAENVENLLERYQNRYEEAKTNYQRGRIRFSSFIATINSQKKHLMFEAITNENDRSVEISGKEYI